MIFYGRSEELASWSNGSCRIQRIVAVIGMGGIGKTVWLQTSRTD